MRIGTVALVMGVVATAVQAIGSWIPSLWGDEAASLLSAERPLSTLWREISHVDAVHATYYLFLHGWIQLAGTSPFAIRFPSAVAVGLCVVAVVLIGARMRSLAAGVVAGVICAVLPRMTYIGEEARSYAFSAAIAAWLTLILIVALTRSGRTRRLWIAYGALLGIGIYVFLYVALIAVAHAVVLLLVARRRRVLVPAALAIGGALLGAAPVIVLAVLERAQIAYLATRPQVTAQSVFVTIWFGQIPFAVLGWILTAAGVVLALRPWVRRRHGLSRRPIELLICVWFLLPAVVLIGTSPIVDGFTARYLAMCAPAVALLMALPILEIAARWRPALAIGTAAVVLAGAFPWASERTPYAKNNSDWSVVSSRLGAVIRPGDAVVFDDAVRPSRRTRLALRTYPLTTPWRNPTLKTPYWKNTTWYDATISVPRAAADGRFDGVTRVWLIEYAIGDHVDAYGVRDLVALGFSRGPITMATHRSRIIEFTRVP